MPLPMPHSMAHDMAKQSSLAKKILFSLPCFFKFSLPLKLKKNFLQEIFAFGKSLLA